MARIIHFTALSAFLLGGAAGVAQEARLRPEREVRFPAQADGTSPAYWLNNRLHLFTSVAWPLQLSVANTQFDEWETREVDITDLAGKGIWIEGAWLDDDGTLYGWYHHEPWGLYEESLLTAPKIGAVVSYDGGRTIRDLGIVLETGDELNVEAQNGFFTGGHGDFSVILDRERKYFYFFFTNYGGPVASQGVVGARMAFSDRFDPVGKVRKYHDGDWTEPGVGGRMTPIFPVNRGWHHRDPDAYWGPSVHWNTYLNCFVMLLNRAKGEPGWAQEGIYVSFASSLDQPDSWKHPGKLLDAADLPGWSTFYPQVLGLEVGGTDTLAGRTARFYVHGVSRWEIDFYSAKDAVPADPVTPPDRRGQPR